MSALCAVAVSTFFSSSIGIVASTALVALGILALFRTADALLVLAALGPIAAVIHGLLRTPYDGNRMFEVAVLVVCGAAALRAGIRGTALEVASFEWVAAGFAVIALASCIAQMPIAMLRLGATNATSATEVLFRDFFSNRAPPLAPLFQAALVLEGLALAALTARAAREPQIAVRLMRMTVIGGAAAAALNVHRLLEVSFRNPPFTESLFGGLTSFRFNTQFGDLNAAGSYFAMVGIMCTAAVAGPGTTSRGRWGYGGLLVLIGSGIWLSGSRVALISAIFCGAGVLILRWRSSRIRAVRWRTVVASAAVLAILFVAALFFFPAHRHGTFGYSVFTRVELLRTAARMWMERPVTGIGIAQFYPQFPKYAPFQLLEAFRDGTGVPIRHENAHNQFAQVLAELGTVGFVAFIAILACALRPGTRPGWARASAIIAIGGFLITCLAGHPLLTPMVAFPFWLMIGVVAAATPPLAPRLARGAAMAVLAVSILMVMTIPVRWVAERRTADLGNVTIGFSHWHRDASGVRFRWAGKRSTFFVASEATLLRLPLRSPDGSWRNVEILLNGRPAAGVQVPPGSWTEVHLPLPRSAADPLFRRIDLNVEMPRDEATADAHEVLMVGRAEELVPDARRTH